MGRVRKQQEKEDEAGKKFPSRTKSVPYGFDFDLDEVWAPNNPHLKHLKNVNATNGGKSKGSKTKSSNFSSCQVG